MKKRWILLIGLSIAMVGVAVSVLVSLTPPQCDLSQFNHLRKPLISSQGARRVLSYTLKGDPAQTATKAYGPLYREFYNIEGIESKAAALPMARWDAGLDIPKSEWVGEFGLELPQGLPAPELKEGVGRPKVSQWDYGANDMVIEMIHVGPYEEVGRTIEVMQKAAQAQGYRLAGRHEEVYLKFPGLIFKGDPQTYQTIVRYGLERFALSAPAAAPE